MCGVLGLISNSQVSKRIHRGLLALQHRGQDASGICTYSPSAQRFFMDKGLGLMSDVFNEKSLNLLVGTAGVGHNRYSTIGSVSKSDIQPVLTGFPYGLTLAHNGNVTNLSECKEQLRNVYHYQLLTQNDAEVLLQYLSVYLAEEIKDGVFHFASLKRAVRKLLQSVKGAFSVAGIVGDEGLFFFNDPHGIRPLCFGQRRDASTGEWTVGVASESQALRLLGLDDIQDLEPGELVFVSFEGEIHRDVLTEKTSMPCYFEYVYFSSPESSWRGQSVYKVRENLGQELADLCSFEIQSKKIKPDFVMPVPDSSRISAIALSEKLGLPYKEALIKNRYIQRSFILNDPTERDLAVQLKLSPVESEIKGKKILVVDDSIVRGTTSKKIIQLLKSFGAAEVYWASTAPPIIHPCFYGIDFPTPEELVAHQRPNEVEISKHLGAEAVIYMTLEGLKRALGLSTFCQACLTGNYIVTVENRKVLSERRKRDQSDSSVKRLS